MNIQIVKNLGLIALLGSLSLPVFAQPGPGGGPGSGQGSGQGYGQGYGPGAGWSLMSPAERDNWGRTAQQVLQSTLSQDILCGRFCDGVELAFKTAQ